MNFPLYKYVSSINSSHFTRGLREFCSLTYAQMGQRQPLYGQRFAHPLPQVRSPSRIIDNGNGRISCRSSRRCLLTTRIHSIQQCSLMRHWIVGRCEKSILMAHDLCRQRGEIIADDDHQALTLLTWYPELSKDCVLDMICNKAKICRPLRDHRSRGVCNENRRIAEHIRALDVIPIRESRCERIYSCFRSGYDHLIRSAAESLAPFSRPPDPRSAHIRPSSHYPPVNGPRRAMTNPSTNLSAMRTYYCETCRIACGGYATYQSHLSGSKHKKKELLSQNTQPSGNIPNKSAVPSFRCELCDITCTSSDAYKAHIDGSKHEKVRDNVSSSNEHHLRSSQSMKLHRRLGKTIPPVEPPIVNQTSDSQSTAQEVQPVSESTIKPIGEEYIETTFDVNRKPVLFHCKLCDCKFNDANAKDAHLKGKRHRISYRVNRRRLRRSVDCAPCFLSREKSILTLKTTIIKIVTQANHQVRSNDLAILRLIISAINQSLLSSHLSSMIIYDHWWRFMERLFQRQV